MQTGKSNRIFKRHRKGKDWLIIIGAAVILHLLLFLFLKLEYLEIFRAETPGDDGSSEYFFNNRPFSLIPYPEDVILPDIIDPAAVPEINPVKYSILDELGEPDVDIKPIYRGGKTGGSDGRTSPERNTVEPKPLFLPWPKYPNGIRKNVKGKVELLLFVNEKGEVDEIKISRGLPQKSLNNAAIEAAKKIRFIPGQVRGIPTAMWVRLTIGFQPR